MPMIPRRFDSESQKFAVELRAKIVQRWYNKMRFVCRLNEKL